MIQRLKRALNPHRNLVCALASIFLFFSATILVPFCVFSFVGTVLSSRFVPSFRFIVLWPPKRFSFELKCSFGNRKLVWWRFSCPTRVHRTLPDSGIQFEHLCLLRAFVVPTWQLWSQRVAFTSTAKKKPLKSDRKLHVRAYCATCDRRIVQLPFRIKQPGRNNEAEGELKFKSNLSISSIASLLWGFIFSCARGGKEEWIARSEELWRCLHD